ncbi:hypothetical protein NG701_05155 [Pseudarthrobacter sp. HLT3-5]|uniref:hypothetical protein n=1 Tax=Pseudarthrobacter cellobiosi TaxID=2953654 RepID=UPI00208DF5FA|nr:hypothetical protein [Pseudarthrobacter sp. HLT3-5]MCO4273822.1 hypothetical protein [Pseudarthrobacter sp. HLT3-5]
MTRINPTQQSPDRANLVRRLYRLSQNDAVRDAGRDATRDATSVTKSVRKLVEAIRDTWRRD